MLWHTSNTSIAVTCLMAAGIIGCGNDDSATEVDLPDSGDVAVEDDFFAPATLAGPGGEEVTWIWQGGNPHNVTWDEADLPNSQTQTTGSHMVTAPTEPGEYGYHCTIHGAPGTGMHGTLVVE